MLDSVNTAPQSEDLAEHNIRTELDRLEAAEIGRMRRAIEARKRAETTAAVEAALETGAGTRYTAAELAAACGAALSLALKGTRGMRLNRDDWHDLRSDLIVLAIARGRECNTARAERADLMPRREDLAGRGKDAGIAYLSGAARRMLADLAADGAMAAKREAWGQDGAAAEQTAAADSAHADMTAAELADIIGATTTREGYAVRHAVEGVALADLAAEHGKTAKGMERAAAKGRETLRERTSPRAIRAAAAEHRAAVCTCQTQHPDSPVPCPACDGPDLPPVEFGHWKLGALAMAPVVLSAPVLVPAATAERADMLTRRTAAERRNLIDRTRELDGPLAPTPYGVGRLIGRKLRAATLEAARRAPAEHDRAPYPARRMTSTGATMDTSGAETVKRNPHHHPHRPTVGGQTADRGTRTVLGADHMPTMPRQASGPMTAAIEADMTNRRTAELERKRVARDDVRAAAERAGKLTILPPAE